MNIFDSHCHYNDEYFENKLNETIKDNLKTITNATVVGYNLKTSEKAIEIANKYNELYATVGISPNDLNTEINYEKLEKLAKNKKVVAIGEIGLDYHWNKENKPLQKEVFIKQIEIANKLNLPIAIHTREAMVDTLEILKKYPVLKKGIFHCCPLNQELIKEGLKLGFYISFSGNITFKNAKNSEACIKLVPLEYQLIETDSPYMTPEPFRGTKNDPSKVIYVAKRIAQAKNIPVEIVANNTYKNAKTIYNIK